MSLLDAVVVIDNGRCVGIGKPLPFQSLHGDAVPDTHQPILLTWAQENYLAPYPCGRKDLEENKFFFKDMLYAVPRVMLKRLIRHANNGKYSLVPFTWNHFTCCVFWVFFFLFCIVLYKQYHWYNTILSSKICFSLPKISN